MRQRNWRFSPPVRRSWGLFQQRSEWAAPKQTIQAQSGLQAEPIHIPLKPGRACGTTSVTKTQRKWSCPKSKARLENSINLWLVASGTHWLWEPSVTLYKEAEFTEATMWKDHHKKPHREQSPGYSTPQLAQSSQPWCQTLRWDHP